MSEEENTQPEEAPVDPRASLTELLKEIPGAPDEGQITEWKSAFGDVFVSAFSDEEVFIFRSLKRGEHRTLQEKLAATQDEVAYENEIVTTCVLWTSVKSLEDKAGTIPTLVEQIFQNSNFMSPQVASRLVMKL